MLRRLRQQRLDSLPQPVRHTPAIVADNQTHHAPPYVRSTDRTRSSPLHHQNPPTGIGPKPKPRAANQRNAERANDQPLAPNSHSVKRARRRAHYPRVGPGPARERDHQPAAPHLHRAGHPPRRADPPVPVPEPCRHRALRRRAPPRASRPHTAHNRPGIRPLKRHRDDPSAQHPRRAHPHSPHQERRRHASERAATRNVA